MLTKIVPAISETPRIIFSLFFILISCQFHAQSPNPQLIYTTYWGGASDDDYGVGFAHFFS